MIALDKQIGLYESIEWYYDIYNIPFNYLYSDLNNRHCHKAALQM